MRTFKPTTAIATLALAALIAGCGSKDADPQTADTSSEPAAAEDSGPDPKADFLDACKLKMTVPEAREWQTSWDPRGKYLVGEGPSTVHSTHWAKGEERQALLDSKTPPLEVACSFENANGDKEILLSIEGRGGLTEADVPFGPGTYPIVPRSNDSNAPKGFWAFPIFGPALFEGTSGTLTISRFDDKGVAGSFHVEGKEQFGGTRQIVIDGTFDMPCRGGMAEGGCTAGKAIVD
jgi:hypothetical protein